MGHEVLYLPNAEVKKMLTMDQTMQLVEETFRLQAEPESAVWGVPLAYTTEDRKLGFRWRLKTAVLRDIPVAGVRVTAFKVDEKGITRSGEAQSTRYVILSDPKTSSPLAIIDEHCSYALRTTAAACVAAKYLARKESKEIGVIGVGNMGRTFLLGISSLFQIEEVRATSRRAETRREFAVKMSDELSVHVVAKDTYKEVCQGADIIITGTPARNPFVKYEWLKDGVFVAAVGPDEVEPEAYARCEKVLVDYDRKIHKHSSNIRRMIESGAIEEESIYGELWEVVTGKKPGRENDNEKILVFTVGLTIQDVAIANWLYKRALEERRGILLPF